MSFQLQVVVANCLQFKRKTEKETEPKAQVGVSLKTLASFFNHSESKARAGVPSYL
jgi:hypothetical protein